MLIMGRMGLGVQFSRGRGWESDQLSINGRPQLVEDRFAHAQLGGDVRRTVERGDVTGDAFGVRIELSRRDHGVQQPCKPSRLRIEHLTGHGGVIEVGGGETVPGEHDGEQRECQPDPDLVESQPKWPVDAQTGVRRHQEKRAGRVGVTGTGNRHRRREGQDS